MPVEIIEYRYREKFHLSKTQVMAEPADALAEFIKITRLEEEQRSREADSSSK